MSSFLDSAYEAGQRYGFLGGLIGFVAASFAYARHPLKDKISEILLIAAFCGFLGTLFGVAYEAFAGLD